MSMDPEQKCQWWGCSNAADSSFVDASDDPPKMIQVCRLHRQKLWPQSASMILKEKAESK